MSIKQPEPASQKASLVLQENTVIHFKPYFSETKLRLPVAVRTDASVLKLLSDFDRIKARCGGYPAELDRIADILESFLAFLQQDTVVTFSGASRPISVLCLKVRSLISGARPTSVLDPKKQESVPESVQCKYLSVSKKLSSQLNVKQTFQYRYEHFICQLVDVANCLPRDGNHILSLIEATVAILGFLDTLRTLYPKGSLKLTSLNYISADINLLKDALEGHASGSHQRLLKPYDFDDTISGEAHAKRPMFHPFGPFDALLVDAFTYAKLRSSSRKEPSTGRRRRSVDLKEAIKWMDGQLIAAEIHKDGKQLRAKSVANLSRKLSAQAWDEHTGQMHAPWLVPKLVWTASGAIEMERNHLPVRQWCCAVPSHDAALTGYTYGIQTPFSGTTAILDCSSTSEYYMRQAQINIQAVRNMT